ncbi:MAG: EAL domain-containing protein [Rhodoferax sp.]|nr:EAL domain-containing protein [Rhodoferax sp.]
MNSRNPFVAALRRTTFRQQLSIMVASGVLLLALLSSLVISWQSSRDIRQNRQQQGQHLSDSLARQARLALLSDASENITDAVSGALAFPDVDRVEIRRMDGRLLTARGAGGVALTLGDEPPPATVLNAIAAFLEVEDSESWQFVAPVRVVGVNSPFDAEAPKAQMIGYVRVVLSKASLGSALLTLFALNMGIAMSFAVVFLLMTRELTRRMTQPLVRLAESMGRAEQGESGVRAKLTGPRDIANMAQAFNSMMAVLDEREQALRLASSEALRLAQIKSEFAATMSHELRTPLNGVVGTLDMLRASVLPPVARNYVALAWDSSQYLLDLINNILDFSSLEAGKLQLADGDFDIARLCEQTIELVIPQTGSKALEIAYVVEPGVPACLRGDARRLRQVLLNLVGNAAKFTERGEVAVRVSAVGEFGKQGTLRITVTDTGVGVAEDEVASIFDAFTQADPSSTRRHDGSGLGLSISKQLCTLMGGEIGVNSTQGVGSTFWFAVPLKLGSGKSTVAAREIRSGRVLVVDESAIIRQFIQQTLAAAGYECNAVETVADAASALLQAQQTGAPYGLLLVDMVLAAGQPQVVRDLRTVPGYGLPRLVLMSRYGLESPAAAPAADANLAKPLRQERLLECVDGTIGSRSELLQFAPRARKRMPQILIVEDNRTSQTIASGMLEMLGCRSEVAANGRIAVQAFKRKPWDLILMDCNMPEMDGYQATAVIRGIETDSGRRVPIVAMTANTQPTDVEKCLSAGMDDHLSKPLTLDSLTARLQRWLTDVDIAAPAPAAVVAGVQATETGEQSKETPIDQTVLVRLREALGGAIGQAIRPFLEDMPSYLDELSSAVVVEERETLRRVAHAIKGAAWNFGALELATLAKTIESLAENNQVDAAGRMLPRLRAEYAVVEHALQLELQSEVEVLTPLSAVGEALVLIVDDDRSTRSALRAALQRSGFVVTEAADGSEVEAEVQRMRPDVILMDALMPVMDGFTACARLQESPEWRQIPILMITALEDSASIERAFAAGASDYIPKPIHLAVVNQRVRRLVDATRAERHVRHLAYNDSLTGLPNRTLFNDHLGRCIERAQPMAKSLALLYLDLDRFKFVNDTLGHEIGDKLLKSVSERIRGCVRASDCVARLGGDEFAIVIDDLPNVNVASGTAQKICHAVTAPFEIDGHDIVVSASIGIAVFPINGVDSSTLLRHADTAMYRAKKKSSGFQFFEENMEASASEHLRFEGALRRALERNEIVVYFQPIANATDCRIVGMEALARWRHPSRGLVSPLEFIPMAEETGLIIPIGESVLRAACLQLKKWHETGSTGLYVTVNLSGLQLQQVNFIDTLRKALRDTGVNPQCLTLEITESMLMAHAEETLLLLRAIKATGVELAIDDFGTGYSSLAYLKRFPVDVLKIDRAFTRDMTNNVDDASIVSGIISLAHNLRLKVVAEGVETEEQRRFLAELKCDCIQGYLLSEPLPSDAFEARFLIANHSG